MSGEDDELETGTLANGVVEEASSTVIEQRQTPIKRPQPEKPVEVPSQTSPVKGTKEGSAQGEEKVPSQACLGESSASPVCTPPRVAEDKPQKGLAEGDKAGKAAAPPDTPVAGSSKPKVRKSCAFL